jgi:hypothetical protein
VTKEAKATRPAKTTAATEDAPKQKAAIDG